MAHTMANEYVINDDLYANTNAHTRKKWLTLSVLHTHTHTHTVHAFIIQSVHM